VSAHTSPPWRADRDFNPRLRTGQDDRIAGPLLAGRYVLLRRIVVGGAAIVYCAEDVVLRRRVVLKVLHEWFTGDDRAPGRRPIAHRQSGRPNNLDLATPTLPQTRRLSHLTGSTPGQLRLLLAVRGRPKRQPVTDCPTGDEPEVTPWLPRAQRGAWNARTWVVRTQCSPASLCTLIST
jgi:hypothetical protein